jgi:hypothetical protein
MRVISKIRLLSLLVVATVFVQGASATLLPISSYEDGYWQGSRFYDEVVGESYLRGRIDFAVYDTVAYPGEFISVDIENEFEGQYIYAYQIFNDYLASEEAVAYFAVFNVEETPMDVHEDSIDSVEDTPDSGVAATWKRFDDSNVKAVWEFGPGILVAGEHSWFLVFSSDRAPVPGDYKISAERGEVPIPPEIPEPSMIALFGIGSATLFVRRRRSVP